MKKTVLFLVLIALLGWCESDKELDLINEA